MLPMVLPRRLALVAAEARKSRATALCCRMARLRNLGWCDWSRILRMPLLLLVVVPLLPGRRMQSSHRLQHWQPAATTFLRQPWTLLFQLSPPPRRLQMPLRTLRR